MGSISLVVYMRERMPCMQGLVCHVHMVLVTLELCMAIEEQYPIHSMVGQLTYSTEDRVKNMARCSFLQKD